MSVVARKWLKRQRIDDRTLIAVLDVLAGEADASGHCAITQDEIASVSHLKERAIRNAIGLLEDFGVIARSRRSNWNRRGRSADAITLQLGRHFGLTKDDIAAARALGLTGTKCRLNLWDLPAPDAGAPTNENEAPLYKERARSVTTPTSPIKTSHQSTTRVRFDRGRNKWRASITTAGVTMDLGRFDTQSEAVAFADQARADVERTSSAKAGTPSYPADSSHLAGLQGEALCGFLFRDPIQEPSDELVSDEASPPSPGFQHGDGVGEAGAMGQGTKFLVGFGAKPHETSRQEAARACARRLA